MRAIRYGEETETLDLEIVKSRNPLCVQLDTEVFSGYFANLNGVCRNPLCVQLDTEQCVNLCTVEIQTCRNPLCVQLDTEPTKTFSMRYLLSRNPLCVQLDTEFR